MGLKPDIPIPVSTSCFLSYLNSFRIIMLIRVLNFTIKNLLDKFISIKTVKIVRYKNSFITKLLVCKGYIFKFVRILKCNGCHV